MPRARAAHPLRRDTVSASTPPKTSVMASVVAVAVDVAAEVQEEIAEAEAVEDPEVAAASARLGNVVLSRRARVLPFSRRRWPRWTADVQACAA